MIEVLIANIDDIDEDSYNYYLLSLPQNMATKILKYYVIEDRYRILIGKVLLSILLTKYTDFTLNDIQYTQYKKPYIADSMIDFNISHSGKYTIVAFTLENKIGIDIEYIKEIHLENFKTVLLENEFNMIINSQHKMKTFFTLWTLKEATLKAEGIGLLGNLKKVIFNKPKISFNNFNYFYISLEYKSHIFSLVYHRKDKIIIASKNLSERWNSRQIIKIIKSPP